ncbi:histidine kinase-like protein [Actinomycetospora succinea]|uniref:Histidine kinase-like protein n=1 Tax=Actinomycetospora succinea TaxID=663603 RepID=A0A4R6VB93_9PSEU|nr:ATP-binding protein [Actinomycetospora succinea]TDQ58905.1 histidine kinase-like protein [Actinomycetospora succinea]
MTPSSCPHGDDRVDRRAADQAERLACVCWPAGEPGDPGWLHERLPAGPLAVRRLRGRMRTWVEASGLDEELAESVVLIVDEAVTNAVEHACPDWDCHVELVAGPRACGDGFAVLVTDNGVWVEPTEPGYRGRGVQLMRELAHRSSIESSETGTAVRLCWAGAMATA